jgi:hypothetical protein
VEEEKPLSEAEKLDQINRNNNLFQIQKVSNEGSAPVREVMDRQADRIMQNILNASKLLEGRITFEQLINLDIPTFENIVSNEFANIDRSYKEFKATGAINAYTKNETTKLDDAFLKDLNKKTSQ